VQYRGRLDLAAACFVVSLCSLPRMSLLVARITAFGQMPIQQDTEALHGTPSSNHLSAGPLHREAGDCFLSWWGTSSTPPVGFPFDRRRPPPGSGRICGRAV